MRRLLPYLLFLMALAALAVSLWRPDSVAHRLGLGARADAAHQRFWRSQLFGIYRRVDANTPPGATIFVGDSLLQGLSGSAVSACHANLSIGGEQSAGVAERLGGYRSMRHAAAIVIATGLNDIIYANDAQLAANYAAIIAALPADRPLILSSLPRLPDKNGRAAAVERANRIIRAACAGRARCRYVDLHGAMPDPGPLIEPDGIHLSADGYALWTVLLRDALAAQGVSTAPCARVDPAD